LVKKTKSLEAYNRRDNLIISELPLANYAEAATVTDSANHNATYENSEITEKSVLALCQQQLKVNIKPADISVAHRLGKPRHQQQVTTVSSKPSSLPPVMVQFTNRKARDMLYAARATLRGSKQPIFINENLTNMAANLFMRARKLVKEKKIFRAWTNQGCVYVIIKTNHRQSQSWWRHLLTYLTFSSEMITLQYHYPS